jgi:hypothetical protein
LESWDWLGARNKLSVAAKPHSAVADRVTILQICSSRSSALDWPRQSAHSLTSEIEALARQDTHCERLMTAGVEPDRLVEVGDGAVEVANGIEDTTTVSAGTVQESAVNDLLVTPSTTSPVIERVIWQQEEGPVFRHVVKNAAPTALAAWCRADHLERDGGRDRRWRCVLERSRLRRMARARAEAAIDR